MTPRPPGPDDRAPSPRAPRSDAVRNRERILTAAAVAFAKDGDAASMRRVAKDADVGVGTVFRQFPTREDLVAATSRRYWRCETPLARLKVLLNALVDGYPSWPAICSILSADSRSARSARYILQRCR